MAWGGQQAESERGVWVLQRGRLLNELETPASRIEPIDQLLVFGSWIVGCGATAIEVWKADNYEHYTTITPAGSREVGVSRTLSGVICTLPTFLNKIFVGRQDGNVEIYNISTGKLAHTILAPSSQSGLVTAMQPTPALCVLSIAYTDGSVVLQDVEVDEPVLQLRRAGTQPVTSISFRSDGLGAREDGSQDGVMATASIESGDVTLWDLTRGGRVAGVLRGAHETSAQDRSSGVNKIEFLAGQGVLLTTGLDNSLRSWVFDQEPFSAIPRTLHSRSGHAAAISTLEFLPAASDGSDAAGKWLLSAGHDRSLWGFSLRKDGQNGELSQGNVKSKAKKMGNLQDNSSTVEDLKAPPITSIACSLNRDGGMGGVGGAVWANQKTSNAEEVNNTGWESVVTGHEGDRYARTWSWGRKKAGRWIFETGDHSPVTSVAITACGTFALVGSAGGSLDMFNLQSGIHRQCFPPQLNPAQAKRARQRQTEEDEQEDGRFRRHVGSVTGLAVDPLNRTVISASLDGTVKFWDFMTGKVTDTLYVESAAPTALRFNATSGLVSLSCDDLCIRVIDIETKKTVRELWGCIGQIYDHCFSHDGRWIVACAMDSIIRIFDLATGHLIDAFKTATCTNLAMSSTGEYLATAHAGSIGINIWTNKSLFTHVPARQINEEAGIIDLTSSITFQPRSQLAMGDVQDAEETDPLEGGGTSDIDQLDQSLLTLSLMPQSRWQTLLNLDTIRQRNKPIEPPKQPEKAPFFLSSSLANGPAPQPSNKPDRNSTITPAERSHISRLASNPQQHSPFSTLLSTSNPDPTPLISHLTTLSPSAADLEIRTLAPAEMAPFVAALTKQLQSRKDFELVNAWMSCFLRMHGDVVQEVDAVKDAVVQWRDAMGAEERRLGDLVGYCRGVVEFLRSAR